MLAIGPGLAGLAAWLWAQGAGAAVRGIAVFSPGRPADDEALGIHFYDEMRQLGWVEGRSIEYDRVYGGEHMAQMPRLAAELVARKPELIYAAGPPTSSAVKQATSTIPIVFAVVVDPLRAGLVASLARPGGNVTGVTQSIAESLMPKRLQLLREVLPDAKRVGLLGNTGDPGSLADQEAIAPLIGGLGLTMTVANATSPAAFDASVESLIRQRVQAIVSASSLAVSRRERMIEFTNAARIPVVGLNQPMALAGCLFSFGPSLEEQIRRAAHLIDRVLRGTKPADIPVEAADRLELVVNLKSARALGVMIPQTILLRADRVIE